MKRSGRSHPGADTPGSPGSRGAFTLVEMLVAVGLVVLMMTLFATIFQMATGAMSTQKGLAENDQRVRLVLTRLRNDLNGNTADSNDPNRPYRTFRNLVPYGPDEFPLKFTDRVGYFYISENDPNDDTDDVLAFTVQMPQPSVERFTGRAAVVFPDGASNWGTFQSPATQRPTPNGGNPYPPAQPLPPAPDPLQVANFQQGQQYWPNQPEFDDVQGTPNGAGASNYAEICYFLRRGSLYRRLMLVRQPNITPLPPDGTPRDLAGAALIQTVYSSGTRSFWTDFDYAAFFDSLTGNGLRFHCATTSPDSLDVSGPVNPFTLGNPAFRFGFDCTFVGGVPGATFGQPREFITTPNNGTPPNATFFIGRFTQAETSDPRFGYPGFQPAVNPMNLNTLLYYNTTTGGVGNSVGSFYAGARAGEDVLMTNVLKFDIKVFDPAASPGPDQHPGIAGFVHPLTGVLDDDDGDGIADNAAEFGWPGSDDGDFRDIGHGGSTGFYNFNPQNVPVTMFYKQATITAMFGNPRPPLDYLANTNYSNPNTGKNRFDTWNPKLDLDNDGRMDRPPFRPFNFGPDGKPGIAGFDDDGINGPDDIGELGWPQTDDQPEALRAIQIKITFYDRTSKQVRETTLVQSLLYQP